MKTQQEQVLSLMRDGWALFSSPTSVRLTRDGREIRIHRKTFNRLRDDSRIAQVSKDRWGLA